MLFRPPMVGVERATKSTPDYAEKDRTNVGEALKSGHKNATSVHSQVNTQTNVRFGNAVSAKEIPQKRYQHFPKSTEQFHDSNDLRTLIKRKITHNANCLIISRGKGIARNLGR